MKLNTITSPAVETKHIRGGATIFFYGDWEGATITANVVQKIGVEEHLIPLEDINGSPVIVTENKMVSINMAEATIRFVLTFGTANTEITVKVVSYATGVKETT